LKTKELYTPHTLHLCNLPNTCFNAEWSDHYVFVGRNRDSSVLSNCNFDVALNLIGGETTDDQVVVVRENHCLVGWVEWIGIHKDNTDTLIEADNIAGAFKEHSMQHSTMDQEEADLVLAIVIEHLEHQQHCDKKFNIKFNKKKKYDNRKK
jgi:hypothetical protein